MQKGKKNVSIKFIKYNSFSKMSIRFKIQVYLKFGTVNALWFFKFIQVNFIFKVTKYNYGIFVTAIYFTYT